MVPANRPTDPNPQSASPQPQHIEPNQHEPVEQQESSTEVMTYRRAPKLPVFLILGGAVGAIVGMLVGVLGSGNAMFTTGQVVGYMIAIFTLLGFSVGAVVALILDRSSIKRAQDVETRVERQASERAARMPEGTGTENNPRAQVHQSDNDVKE